MDIEKINGLYEIIELILSKDYLIIDSFLFDSLASYIYIVFPQVNDEVDSLIYDLADICEEASYGDYCLKEREELRNIYKKLKKLV